MTDMTYAALPEWFDRIVEWVHLRQSDDDWKRDLELTCQECGAHLCDAQDDDSLACLIRMAIDHAPACPMLLGATLQEQRAALARGGAATVTEDL